MSSPEQHPAQNSINEASKDVNDAYAFPRLLKFWRGVHKVSQEALALRLDSSARHISFLENGRAHPSKEMVEKIAAELSMGSRDKGHLLVSAGYMPGTQEVDFHSGEMRWLRNAMIMALKSQDPYPAALCNSRGDILMVNKGWINLFQQSHTPEQLNAVTNIFEFTFSHMGEEESSESWKDTLSLVLMAVTQHSLMSGDDNQTIIEKLTKHPNLPDDWKQRAANMEPMASYRVQITLNGQSENFFNISQLVGAMGPGAYLSSPNLFTTTLYPENPELDLASLNNKSPQHPLLFY